MDEDEEDEIDNHIPVLDGYYGDFADAAMGDAAQENLTDGLAQMLRDAEKDCDNKKELKKIQRML